MPLIKPKKAESEVIEISKEHLYEEFIVSPDAPGVWVTSDWHHIYGGYKEAGSFGVSPESAEAVIGIFDSRELVLKVDYVSGDNILVKSISDVTTSDNANHWFLFESDANIIPHNIFGIIKYDSERDDVTYTDEFKYYALMDSDMKCWQILKSKARESVVGTTTGIASSKYGVTKIVEVNASVATNPDGTLSDELIGATLSAWTGYWKNTRSGTTIYYNTWKA